jgi:hypothetical protein
MRKLIFSILIFFALLFNVKGQDIKVTASFDTSRIYIGDQIEFKITIDQPADLQLAIVSFKDSLIKNIEILSGPAIDTTKRDGRTIIEHNYLITSFDTGRYQLPPVYVETKSDNDVKRFYSDYTFLEVVRTDITPPDNAQIFDIIAPYKAPIGLGEILPWLLALLLAAMLAYLGIRLYKKYSRQKTVDETIEELPDPAHIIAFRELEKLKAEELWQHGEIKLYYTILTEILRQYLENRFGVNSLELTTDETLTMLLRSGFKKDKNYKQLKNILEEADMVKFAKYNPVAADNETCFQEAWNFIDATKHIDNENLEGGAK